MRISPQKRIRNMINGLEEIEAEYRAKSALSDKVTSIYLEELKRAKQALEHLWKSSVG